MRNKKIYCIIVTYQPDKKHLRTVISSITLQTPNVILVDNTPGTFDITDISNDVQLIALGKNLGIATAQNIGIRKALEHGADIVWLSDQDTVYPENFLDGMLKAMEQCSTQGIRLAALGPSYFDTHKNAIQSFLRHAPFTEYFTPLPGIQNVSHTIASGKLIPAEILREVGLMYEDFFIDWVDIEWCWRANKKFGYQTVCTGDVVIQHTMGDGSRSFLKKKFSIRNPSRRYYMIRNAIHVAIHSHSATLPIRFEVFAKAMIWVVAFPLIASSNRLEHVRAVLSGLLDGLRNKMGEKTLGRK